MSPALGEEVNKDAGHSYVCGAQGSQSLDKTPEPTVRACLHHQALNCRLPATKKNYKKYSLYFSLPFSCWLLKKKFKKQSSFSEIKLDQRKELLGGWATVDSLTKLFLLRSALWRTNPSQPEKLKAGPRKGSRGGLGEHALHTCYRRAHGNLFT